MHASFISFIFLFSPQMTLNLHAPVFHGHQNNDANDFTKYMTRKPYNLIKFSEFHVTFPRRSTPQVKHGESNIVDGFTKKKVLPTAFPFRFKCLPKPRGHKNKKDNHQHFAEIEPLLQTLSLSLCLSLMPGHINQPRV